MAKLRVFISSTYYDLKHVRSYVEDFISKMGYEATLSEKGKIAYDPSMALDQSCYQDAQASDILVLIVGGRYGSATSESENRGKVSDFYERYESVTRKEFETANTHDIPTYILVEKSVMSEYETFKKNRTNDTIEYAHVDSVNIFHFLDDILHKNRNNPLFQFEQPQEIESWLKEQWSGYFRTLLEKKSQNQQLNSLSKQVNELNSINNSLQRYLEEVIQKVIGEPAKDIIQKEHDKLMNEKLDIQLMENSLFRTLVNVNGVEINEAKKIYAVPDSIEGIVDEICKHVDRLKNSHDEILKHWKTTEERVIELNAIRTLLGKEQVEFKKD